MGKKLQAKQNRFGFQIFFEATKKIVSFQKTKLVNEYYKTQCFLIEKFVVVGKTGQTLKQIFLAGSKKQHLPRVKLSLFSKHPFGGFYR